MLANAPNGRGGAWNREGTILFAPTAAGSLFKVAATGGVPVAVTRLETGQGAQVFPQFFPDGRHFIYIGGGPAAVYAASLDGASSRRLANANTAAVSPSGFLLLRLQTTLFAQAFDFKRQELSGNPFPVAEQVAGFSATSGIVAYRTGSPGVARQLTWLDRSGKGVGAIGAPDSAVLTDVELSPDAKRVAVTRTVNGNPDVWLIDTARGTNARLARMDFMHSAGRRVSTYVRLSVSNWRLFSWGISR